MSSFFLKIFALVFMIIDHVGFIFFPSNLIYRAIGRLAFPLFSYQMAIGFSHTKNKEKHILKLFLFAIICQLPHTLMLNLYNLKFNLNIIFTFLVSLLIIYAFNKFSIPDNTKKCNFKNCIIASFLSVLLLRVGTALKVDYGWYGILLTVAFYFTLNKKLGSFLLFFLLVNLNFLINQSTMSLLTCVSLLDTIFILFFNGKKGYKLSWIFYVIYFLHLFPLLFIKHFIS